MGPFPRVMLIACLNVLGWLFLATAGLLVILVVVQQIRGDADALPLQLTIAALGMAGLGLLSRWAGRRIAEI